MRIQYGTVRLACPRQQLFVEGILRTIPLVDLLGENRTNVGEQNFQEKSFIIFHCLGFLSVQIQNMNKLPDLLS